jgi:hypothetical protein
MPPPSSLHTDTAAAQRQPHLRTHAYRHKGVSTSVQRWGDKRSERSSACSIPTETTIHGRKWGAGPHSEGSLYRSGYPFRHIWAGRYSYVVSAVGGV